MVRFGGAGDCSSEAACAARNACQQGPGKVRTGQTQSVRQSGAEETHSLCHGNCCDATIRAIGSTVVPSMALRRKQAYQGSSKGQSMREGEMLPAERRIIHRVDHQGSSGHLPPVNLRHRSGVDATQHKFAISLHSAHIVHSDFEHSVVVCRSSIRSSAAPYPHISSPS